MKKSIWLQSFPLVLSLLLVGCETFNSTRAPLPPTSDSASRVIGMTAPVQVAPVARQVLAGHFRINQEASSQFDLISLPKEMTDTTGEPQRVRDVLAATPNRKRQVARLWLERNGPDTMLFCRVIIQRLDTSERAAFQRSRGDDRPFDTPIDREGAASVNEERQDWTDVGRDRRTENLILNSIQEQLEIEAAE